jgi:starch phosphorylase
MAQLTPRFSASRAVREYTEQHYLPNAAAYLARSADLGSLGRQMVDWRRAVDREWAKLHFGACKVETAGQQHCFEVQVHLGQLEPDSVAAEIFADGVAGGPPVRLAMERVHSLVGAVGGYLYRAAVPADRPVGDFTVRMLPHRAGVAIPLECPRIRWQR